MYQFSPRMVPRHLFPKAEKRFIEIGSFRSKQKETKNAVSRRGSNTKSIGLYLKSDPKGAFMTSSEFAYWHSNFAMTEHETQSIELRMRKCLSCKLLLSSEEHHPESTTDCYPPVCLSSWTHLLTAPTRTHFIGHSLSCDTLTNVLTFTDHLQTNDESLNNLDITSKEVSKQSCEEETVSDVSKREIDHHDNDVHVPPLTTCVNLPATQSAVPLPPAIDSLNWLDGLMSTQHLPTRGEVTNSKRDNTLIEMRDLSQDTPHKTNQHIDEQDLDPDSSPCESLFNCSLDSSLVNQIEVQEDIASLDSYDSDTIPESPIALPEVITHSTPTPHQSIQTKSHLTPQIQVDPCHIETPDSEDQHLKKSRGKRLREHTKTIRQPDFLRSPTSQSVIVNRLRDGEEEEEENIDAVNFIEKEASDIDCSGTIESDDTEDDEYDLNDDFINDKSVLTQYITPPHKTHHSPVDMTDVYRRSLISPLHPQNNQYKLVLSQRYKILNRYMNKETTTSKTKKRKIDNDSEINNEEPNEGSMLSLEDSTLVDDNATEGETDEEVSATQVSSGENETEILPEQTECSSQDEISNNIELSQKIAQLVQSGVIVSPSILVRDCFSLFIILFYFRIG